MTRSARSLLLLIALLLTGTVWAQRCVNHIAVDGTWLKGPGFAGQAACYFLDYGNSGDAFTPAELLAEAMGLELAWDGGSKTLTLTQGTTVAKLKATSAIAAGLEYRADVFTVDGEPFGRPIPSAILVDGASWVPVGSITEAFDAEALWDPQNKIIFIETAAYRARIEAARAEAAEAAQAALPADGPMLAAPDVGFHGDFTRVALDIPAGASYKVSADRDTLVLAFPGLQARPFSLQPNDYPHVDSLRYGLLGGVLALEIETQYPLDPGGSGYRLGRLPGGGQGGGDRLYVDFGPALQGEEVATLAGSLQPLPQRAAGAPVPQVRHVDLERTVVLDPGHGGKFAGARGVNGIKEEVLVLEVAFKVKALLEAHGIKVVMTRTSNTHLSTDYDSDLVARANFATAQRNLFVSIHANAANASSAHGIETYIFGRPLNQATLRAAFRENGGDAFGGQAVTDNALAYANRLDGDLLAQEIMRYSRTLAQSVQSHLLATTGAEDRGVEQAPFRVLTQSRIPAILVELGFVTNPSEGAKLTSDAYQDKLAEGIAAGILAFFEGHGSLATR